MTVLFVLKYFADISYYMIFAAFAGGALGLPDLMQWQVLALVACSLLCRKLYGWKPESFLRLVPLLAAPLLFLLPGGWKAFILVLPPLLYLAYSVCKRLFFPDRGDTVDVFSLLCKILPAPVLLALVFRGGTIFKVFSFPYLLAFLFCYVLLLRMLRHDDDVLRQRRFRVLNALELGAAVLVAFALFSPEFRWLVGRSAGLLYSYIIAPILLGISYLFVGLGWLLSKLLIPLLPKKQQELQQQEQTTDDLKNLIRQQEGQPSEVLFHLLIALGILFAAVLIFLLFRRLLAQRQHQQETTGEETREHLSTPPLALRPLRRLAARSPELQVRYWYRKYLLLARARGADLTAYQNTQQQLQVSEPRFDNNMSQLESLRALYLRARYAGTADINAAKAAKHLYEELKNAK